VPAPHQPIKDQPHGHSVTLERPLDHLRDHRFGLPLEELLEGDGRLVACAARATRIALLERAAAPFSLFARAMPYP
jgi:hypothetical protein